MRIEECFELFTNAALKYNPCYKHVPFSIRESDQKDYLLCDIARVLGNKTHKSIKKIADIIVNDLPFIVDVLDNGDIKFNLWQEVRR